MKFMNNISNNINNNENNTSNEAFRVDSSGSELIIRLSEPLTLLNASSYDRQFNQYFGLDSDSGNINSDSDSDSDNIKELILECSWLTSYDSYFVVFVNSVEHYCNANGLEFKITGMSGQLERFLKILSPKSHTPEKLSYRPSRFRAYFTRVGILTVRVFRDAFSFIEFIGDLFIKLSGLMVHPGNIRWKDFPYQFLRAGVNALPIVVLIVFLIGVITGYQGALQLRQFGADIYVADLIGISITRELAPLMTAILVAGRSGSAFAAEIGTMKVSEEIDALGAMGFDSMKFLVIPRVLAVTLSIPIITLFADVAGIGGGMIMALSTLDITLTGYLNQLTAALSLFDIFSGLAKSMIFGFLIATVGCFRGFQVSGGAEAVGKYTTASVVSGVLLIILADAVFTFVFNVIGL